MSKVYFATEKNSKKARNISANPRITMVFDEYSEEWDYLRGIMIRCEARIVRPAEFRQLRKHGVAATMYAKYAQTNPNQPSASAIP